MEKLALSLYVWEGGDVLRLWQSGHVLALASDADEARRIVREAHRKHYADLFDNAEYAEFRAGELAFLDRDPRVCSQPEAWVLWGSA